MHTQRTDKFDQEKSRRYKNDAITGGSNYVDGMLLDRINDMFYKGRS